MGVLALSGVGGNCQRRREGEVEGKQKWVGAKGGERRAEFGRRDLEGMWRKGEERLILCRPMF